MVGPRPLLSLLRWCNMTEDVKLRFLTSLIQGILGHLEALKMQKNLKTLASLNREREEYEACESEIAQLEASIERSKTQLAGFLEQNPEIFDPDMFLDLAREIRAILQEAQGN